MQQLFGILLVIACVFGGFLIMGGSFGALWHPVELLIIIGAALGALVLGNPRHVLKELSVQLRKIVMREKPGIKQAFERELLMLMYELLQVGRDLKALDAHVERPHESALFRRYPMVLKSPKLLAFIVDNFRLMAMGKISAHELEGVLDQELDAVHDDLEQPSKSLRKISDAMPGFGILAAVLGVILALNSVSDGATAAMIAQKVGSAMVGTFLGVFMCYGVLDPLSNTIQQAVKHEVSELECVKVVLVAYAAGKPPLLAVDAGRRLVPLGSKPSFVQMEGWINQLGGVQV